MSHVFREDSFIPLPSQEAMTESIGKGGNGVVAYIYHGGREFAAKETGLRQEELETWSSVSHRNVIELCAVIEGEWDSQCPGARRCFQMMPRVTGELIMVVPSGLIFQDQLRYSIVNSIHNVQLTNTLPVSIIVTRYPPWQCIKPISLSCQTVTQLQSGGTVWSREPAFPIPVARILAS